MRGARWWWQTLARNSVLPNGFGLETGRPNLPRSKTSRAARQPFGNVGGRLLVLAAIGVVAWQWNSLLTRLMTITRSDRGGDVKMLTNRCIQVEIANRVSKLTDLSNGFRPMLSPNHPYEAKANNNFWLYRFRPIASSRISPPVHPSPVCHVVAELDAILHQYVT